MATKLLDGQLIGEWHYNSLNSKERLIVLSHGYKSSAENSTIISITKGLNKDGHDTFTFNFLANAGGFDIKHQVADIAQIVTHFRDYQEIVLLAASFGALTAAIATVQFQAVRGLITLNGFFGKGQLGENHRRNYMKFRIAAVAIPKYRKIWQYFRQGLRPEDIEVPVLVIHSEADRYVFISQ